MMELIAIIALAALWPVVWAHGRATGIRQTVRELDAGGWVQTEGKKPEKAIEPVGEKHSACGGRWKPWGEVELFSQMKINEQGKEVTKWRKHGQRRFCGGCGMMDRKLEELE